MQSTTPVATQEVQNQATEQPEQPAQRDPPSSTSAIHTASATNPSSITTPSISTNAPQPITLEEIPTVFSRRSTPETALIQSPRPRADQQVEEIGATQTTSNTILAEDVLSDPHGRTSSLATQNNANGSESSQKSIVEVNSADIPQRTSTNDTSSVILQKKLPTPGVVDHRATSEINSQPTVPVQTAADRLESSERTLPWTTVNAQHEERGIAELNTKKRRGTTKRKRGPVTLRNIDEEEAEEEEEEEEEGDGDGDGDYVTPKRKSGKSRRKKTTGETDPATDGMAEDHGPPAKKPRRTRKAKAKEDTNEVTGENGQGGDAAAPSKARRKARKKPSQPLEGATVEGHEDNENRAPKRKGRPPREDTPSDAENERIDAETTFMGNLASRNIRVGRLSQRERKMREANWEEIRQKWREDDALGSSRSREEQAEALKKLNEVAQAGSASQSQGEQLEMGEDGQFRLKATARVIDQGAEADRLFESMELVAEDDLTNRITHKSFLRNNKRHPHEFMLPGQGRRWNLKDTNDFYDALRMFGTDFMMISTLFPGATRRSIKLKFVREERADPEGIKEVLHGRMNSDWGQYLTNSGREASDFKDPDEIKRELEEEKLAFDVQIAAAKEAAEEERRQKRLAGLDSEGEEAAEKENANGKKKKGKKDKSVTFAEEGVEVLGTVDENDGWGQE